MRKSTSSLICRRGEREKENRAPKREEREREGAAVPYQAGESKEEK